MDLSESHFSNTVCSSLTSKLLQGAEVNGYTISFLYSWWIQTGTGPKLLLLPKQSQIDGSTLPCFYLVLKLTKYLVNWNQWLPACWVFPGSICPVQREHLPHHFFIIFLMGALVAVVAVCLLKKRELRMELAKNRFFDLK